MKNIIIFNNFGFSASICFSQSPEREKKEKEEKLKKEDQKEDSNIKKYNLNLIHLSSSVESIPLTFAKGPVLVSDQH